MSKMRYDAMMIEEYVDAQGTGRSKWTKIGAAFENKDGSIGIQLNAMPLNGKVILQVPLTKEERDAKFGKKDTARPQTGGCRPQGQPQRGGYGSYGGRQPPTPATHPNDDAGFADDEGPPGSDEIPF